MHIILKQSSREGENDQILNMFYCPNQTIIRDWVKNWIKTDIKAKNEASDADKQQDITYEINDAETNFQLIKRYKKIHKGYIYNLSEKVSEIDYKISILEFNDNLSTETLENEKWSDINNEINNEEYLLEVSSPGIIRRLKTVDHYKKQIGNTIKIKTFKKIQAIAK